MAVLRSAKKYPKKKHPKFPKRKRQLFSLNDFFRSWPILVNSPFVALGETVYFPPWDRFFDFFSPSYDRFRKEKTVDASKVFPLPTLRALSASNNPSALSARAGIWSSMSDVKLKSRGRMPCSCPSQTVMT